MRQLRNKILDCLSCVCLFVCLSVLCLLACRWLFGLLFIYRFKLVYRLRRLVCRTCLKPKKGMCCKSFPPNRFVEIFWRTCSKNINFKIKKNIFRLTSLSNSFVCFVCWLRCGLVYLFRSCPDTESTVACPLSCWKQIVRLVCTRYMITMIQNGLGYKTVCFWWCWLCIVSCKAIIHFQRITCYDGVDCLL